MPRKKNEVDIETMEGIDYVKENKKLKEEIEQLKKIIEELRNEKKNTVDITESTVSEIPLNKLIKVVSLFHGILNLITNSGKVITFNHFGAIKPITFGDLMEICDRQKRLAEEGYFMILDKDAVEALYLTEAYKKIVGKEVIENIITLPEEEIKEILENTTDAIKESIIDTIIKGINAGDIRYLDKNKIYFIGQILGKDLFKMAEDVKAYNVQ
jgi:cell division septum initiation protein DivIVA